VVVVVGSKNAEAYSSSSFLISIWTKLLHPFILNQPRSLMLYIIQTAE
jgi:hypothetical protein